VALLIPLNPLCPSFPPGQTFKQLRRWRRTLFSSALPLKDLAAISSVSVLPPALYFPSSAFLHDLRRWDSAFVTGFLCFRGFCFRQRRGRPFVLHSPSRTSPRLREHNDPHPTGYLKALNHTTLCRSALLYACPTNKKHLPEEVIITPAPHSALQTTANRFLSGTFLFRALLVRAFAPFVDGSPCNGTFFPVQPPSS